MKLLTISILTSCFLFVRCNQNSESTTISNHPDKKVEDPLLVEIPEIEEIQLLIREVLKWAESENEFDLLPVYTDESDSIYAGFDEQKLRKNLEILEKTDLFSKEFIHNYHQIILKLSDLMEIDSHEYGQWNTYEYPPFNFASGLDPWTLCQDVPYDTPIAREYIDVEHVKDDLYQWKWGGLKENTGSDWEQFRYKFKVVRENSQWKVSYLEGFDLEKIE